MESRKLSERQLESKLKKEISDTEDLLSRLKREEVKSFNSVPKISAKLKDYVRISCLLNARIFFFDKLIFPFFFF